MGLRREEAARPVETRVLPREVLEAHTRKVGWLRGTWSCECAVVERCLTWRRWRWPRRWRDNRKYIVRIDYLATDSSRHDQLLIPAKDESKELSSLKMLLCYVM